MKQQIPFRVICLMLMVLLAASVVEGSTRKKAKKEREARDRQEVPWQPPRYGFAIVPGLGAGAVIGQASDAIDDFESGFKNKIFYGIGLGVEYYPRPASAFALNADIIWKDLPVDDLNAIRILEYSGSWLYRFRPEKRASFFARLTLGLASAKVTDIGGTGVSVSLDTRPFMRVSLGEYRHTTQGLSLRTEVYYQIVFTDGAEIKSFVGNYEVDFDANCIGLRLSLGIHL
ncbi:MAG: hypothetical protein OEW00_04265 [candidate division Zixibacteria bacterium]|nr:hypothetical protein [candidate division Zixibacteria bacterium]